MIELGNTHRESGNTAKQRAQTERTNLNGSALAQFTYYYSNNGNDAAFDTDPPFLNEATLGYIPGDIDTDWAKYVHLDSDCFDKGVDGRGTEFVRECGEKSVFEFEEEIERVEVMTERRISVE